MSEPYEERRRQIALFVLGGAPAASAAAWLSAVDKAEREGLLCPKWSELEALAPSVLRERPRFDTHSMAGRPLADAPDPLRAALAGVITRGEIDHALYLGDPVYHAVVYTLERLGAFDENRHADRVRREAVARLDGLTREARLEPVSPPTPETGSR